MNLKKKVMLIAALIAVIAVATAPSARAQQISTLTDQAAYSPGGTGTLTITIVNNSPTNTLEIRNLTIYFPWAGFVNGKWLTGANITDNLAPYQVLTTSGSPGGGNIFTYTTQFSIPSYFGYNSGSTNCPFSASTRYSTYSNCILLGTNQNGLQYETARVNIPMAIPTYNAPSFIDMIIPTATFAILVVATGLLFAAWTSIKRLEIKKPN